MPVTDTPGVTNASNETNEISQQQTVSASGKANQYPCPLCGKVLSRRYTVLQHFPGCARRRGNPEGKAWTDHPKNHGYVPRRVAGAWNGNRKTWRKGLPSSLTPAHPFRPMNGFSTIIPDQANSTARAAETSEPSVATVENVSQVTSITALQAYPFGYANQNSAWNTSYTAQPMAGTAPYPFGYANQDLAWNTSYTAQPMVGTAPYPFGYVDQNSAWNTSYTAQPMAGTAPGKSQGLNLSRYVLQNPWECDSTCLQALRPTGLNSPFYVDQRPYPAQFPHAWPPGHG